MQFSKQMSGHDPCAPCMPRVQAGKACVPCPVSGDGSNRGENIWLAECVSENRYLHVGQYFVLALVSNNCSNNSRLHPTSDTYCSANTPTSAWLH